MEFYTISWSKYLVWSFIQSADLNIWFGVYTISWSKYLVWSVERSANFINLFGIKILNAWFSLIFYIQNHAKIANFLLSISSSSDPSFIEWNTRFTAEPFKVLIGQVWIKLYNFILNNFRSSLLTKVTCTFLLYKL